MDKITSSMEWVYHSRGKNPDGDSLVRKYQLFCWQRLFGDKKRLQDVVFDLNDKWLPDGKKVVLLNPADPVEFYSIVKSLLTKSSYDIVLTVKDTPNPQQLHLFE